MANRTDARYAFSLKNTRIMALNDDLTKPSPENIIGGVGPFDFSGVTSMAAVEMAVKIDTVETEFTVDLSDVGIVQTAVTVDDLVTALTAAFSSETLSLTSSKDSTTGRLKIVSSADPLPGVLQVYGELAELAMIGQGYGVKYIKSDTFQSIALTPRRKDSETLSLTDSNGNDVEVMTEGYYKGEDGTIVDTAEDWNIKAIFDGTKVASDGSLSAPLSVAERPFVEIESFYSMYKQGQNMESEVVGYTQETYYKAKGLNGDKTRDRNLNPSNYTFMASNYIDSAGVEHPAWKRTPLTVAEYDALKSDVI